MKSIVLGLIYLFFTTNAFASDFSDQKFLQVLKAESSNVKVFTKDETGEHFLKPLSMILSEYLLGDGAKNDSSVRLTGFDMNCVPVNPVITESVGMYFYIKCNLNLGQGEFSEEENGYEGEPIKSNLMLEFTIKYNESSGKYKVFGNKAVAHLAG